MDVAPNRSGPRPSADVARLYAIAHSLSVGTRGSEKSSIRHDDGNGHQRQRLSASTVPAARSTAAATVAAPLFPFVEGGPILSASTSTTRRSDGASHSSVESPGAPRSRLGMRLCQRVGSINASPLAARGVSCDHIGGAHVHSCSPHSRQAASDSAFSPSPTQRTKPIVENASEGEGVAELHRRACEVSELHVPPIFVESEGEDDGKDADREGSSFGFEGSLPAPCGLSLWPSDASSCVGDGSVSASASPRGGHGWASCLVAQVPSLGRVHSAEAESPSPCPAQDRVAHTDVLGSFYVIHASNRD